MVRQIDPRFPSRLLREIGSIPEGAELLADLHEAFISFVETVSASLGRIEEGLKDPADRTRAFTNGSHPEALIRRVEVVTAGTPVQGPSIEIPRASTRSFASDGPLPPETATLRSTNMM